MTFAEVCQLLCGEPFYLTFSEISQLTPYQVKYILFRPKPDPSANPSPGKSYEEIFRLRLEAKGYTPEEIQALWEKQKKQIQSSS